MDFRNFLSSKTILHSNGGFVEALTLLNQNVVTFDYIERIQLFNISAIKIGNDGNYIHEISIRPGCDIIDNFQLNSNNSVRLSFEIGGIPIDKLDEFIIMAAPYTPLKIVVTFLEKPTFDDEIILTARCYLLNEEDRTKLMSNTVITEGMIYYNGMCRV